LLTSGAATSVSLIGPAAEHSQNPANIGFDQLEQNVVGCV
jgi:hypothetical protein